MATFIILNTREGNRERINPDAIQRYVPSETGSCVLFSNAEMEWYRETPQQIDAMLGVTADPLPAIAERAARLLATGIMSADAQRSAAAEIQAAIAARGE